MMNRKIAALLFCVLFIVLTANLANAFAENTPAEIEPGERKTVNITWSRTTEPNGYKVLPVATWNWSDAEDINFDRTSDVWDGGTEGDFYIKDAVRSWDIATWHTNRAYWNGTADVRRFHGEFTIPDGYSVFDDVMLSSVGDYQGLGLDDIIAINDNIYIFVYPKSQMIDDDNFLEYFAFWTGTAGQEKAKAVNNGELITFHGIEGTTPRDYKEVLGIADTDIPIPPENLLSHTDGWYSEAFRNNIGIIMQKDPEADEFVIDVFVEDYAEDGGMDRLDITFTKMPEVLPPVAETPEVLPPVTETPEVLPPVTETPEVLPPVAETPEEAPKTGDASLVPYALLVIILGICLLWVTFKRAS